MVSHLFFYQLGLIALVWLCLMRQWTWPSNPAACPPPPAPTPPGPNRDRVPQPFTGLTTKPPCDAWAHGSALRPEAPHTPPPAQRAAARWTPRPLCARPRTVPIEAGWAGAIAAPMAIRAAAPGANGCASPVTAIIFS